MNYKNGIAITYNSGQERKNKQRHDNYKQTGEYNLL